MDVQQHDIGLGAPDALDGRLDVDGLADDLHRHVGAAGQLGPHAGQEQAVVVDEEHPDRPGRRAGPARWRRRRRGGTGGHPASSGALARATSTLTSVPSPGALEHPGASAVAGHAPHDRPRDALPVVVDRRGVEPAPPVADERLDTTAVDLDVHRHDRRTAVVGGVHHGLSHGLDQRRDARVERAVAHEHDGDLDRRVVGLDLVGEPVEGEGERAGRVAGRAAVGPVPVVVQPGAQLALLTPGEAPGLGRRVGVPLDQRQRLQDRVVQVRRHVGPLLAADAFPPLVAELADESHDPRAEDEDDTEGGGQHGDAHLADRAERRVRGEEHGDAEDQQECTAEHPQPEPPAAAQGLERVGRQPGAGIAPHLTPSRARGRRPAGGGVDTTVTTSRQYQADADRSERARPDDEVGEERRAPAHEHEQAERDAAHREGELRVAAARPVPVPRAGRRGAGGRFRRRLGQHDPGDEVGDHADAVRQRQDQRGEAHDDGVDAEPPRHARADAGHDVLVGAADQPGREGREARSRGRGHRLPHMMTPTTAIAPPGAPRGHP